MFFEYDALEIGLLHILPAKHVHIVTFASIHGLRLAHVRFISLRDKQDMRQAQSLWIQNIAQSQQFSDI